MGISIEIKFQLSFIIFPKVVDYDTRTMLFKEDKLQSTTKKEINNTFFFGHLKHSYEMKMWFIKTRNIGYFMAQLKVKGTILVTVVQKIWCFKKKLEELEL